MRMGLRKGLFAFALVTTLGTGAGGVAAQGLAGPYLAASQADLRNDYLAASSYYDQALAISPDNPVILQNTMTSNIAAGRLNRGIGIAKRLLRAEPGNQIAGLALIAEAFRAGDFAAAGELAGDEKLRLNPLLAELLKGWAQVGAGDYDAAMATFEGMTGNSAFEAYGGLHQALARALAGDFATAATLLDGDEEGPLHLNRMAMLAHIVSLSQAERMEDAIRVAEDALGSGLADPELEGMLARLTAGEALPFDQIASAADGAAAAYAVMAAALSREEAQRLGLIYGRLATHMRPAYDEVTTLIAEILDEQEQYELAIAAYEEVAPGSSWYVTAEIGRAEALRGAERIEEAIEVLSNLGREQPEDLSIQTALGDLLRSNEDFPRASEAYTRAIDLIQTEIQPHWLLYYSRGITLERTDRWGEAEADFRRALELNPEQPLVLNYLGYSLVELRRNLDEAQAMIESAVAQRPQDGYITDSLGWVLYRLGKFDEAVQPMERAVELMPVDPIINDHLGDVLWMVGRKLEAEFQWKRALSFEPEEEDATRIRKKLDIGLDAVLAEEAAAGGEAETALGD